MKKLKQSPRAIVFSLLDHFESYVCQVLLVFFVVTLLMQIILRSIDCNLHWTEEVARYAFLWFILFGACYATRLCALNRVTMQFAKLPAIVGKVCMLFSDMVWLAFCLAMAWYGYLAVIDLAEFPYYTPALDWNLSKVYLIFPISFSLMAIRIIQVNFERFVLGREPIDPDQQALEESTQALAGGE